MYYPKRIGALIVGLFFSLFCLSAVAMAEGPTPDEVIAKVHEAAKVLQEQGAEALPQFSDKNNPKWIFKGTYLFVFDANTGITVAHPYKPGLVGKNTMGIRDKKGNMLFMNMADTAKNPKGGWSEYWWPKPGEKTPSRKISYAYRVPGTPYIIGCGIYNDSISVESLNAKLK